MASLPTGQIHPSLPSYTFPTYSRPAEWLPLPLVATTEEKFVGLFAVYDIVGNYIALQFEGDYTVDWGDGVTEDFASGVKAQHDYDYTSISNSTICSRGYKQVLITVTPQTGQQLTIMDLSVVNDIFPSEVGTPWLDFVLSLPNLTTFFLTNSGVSFFPLLETCTIMNTSSVSALAYFYLFESIHSLKTVYFAPNSLDSAEVFDGAFSDCYSLSFLTLPNLPSVVSLEDNYMFSGCYSLQWVTYSGVPNVQSIGYLHNYNYNLEYATILNSSSVESFRYSFFETNLKTFNVQSLDSATDFSFVFQESGVENIYLPAADSITYFGRSFDQCPKLNSVRLESMSSVLDFNHSFSGCYSLGNLAISGLPSVTDFTYSWRYCTGLSSFPLFDTSSGVYFYGAWYACYGLTSFPALELSAGEDFSYAWAYCTSLTSFPLLDVSSGTNFTFAWYGCQSLTTFPLLDVSSGTDFNSAWADCNSLTSFPLLDVSSGTNFGGAWGSCNSLTSFPLLDVSSGTDFYYTWAFCNSLTSFPLLNVSSGTTFNSAWAYCNSLTTFPAGMFDNCTATNFYYAWFNCALSQESVDNILVSLDTAGQSNGTVNINNGTSSAPGTAGLSAKASLQGKGWTVITN